MSTNGKPMAVIHAEIRRRREIVRRDLAAKRKDRSRDSLREGVEEFLAKGGKIQEVPGYVDGPRVLPVRIHGRGLY